MNNKVARPAWEKQGNTAWVACPECSKWFPVSQDLIDRQICEFVCPKCAYKFNRSHAKETVIPS